MCASGMFPGNSGGGGGKNFDSNPCPGCVNSSNDSEPRVIGPMPNHLFGLVVEHISISSNQRPSQATLQTRSTEAIRVLLSDYCRNYNTNIRDLQIDVIALILNQNILGCESDDPVVGRATIAVEARMGTNWRNEVSNNPSLVDLVKKILNYRNQGYSIIDILNILCPSNSQAKKIEDKKEKSEHKKIDNKNNIDGGKWYNRFCNIF